MDKTQAIELAMRWVNERFNDPEDSLVALEDRTRERPYGWVVFYQSRIYVEQGDDSYMLAGNGPVVVLKDGTLHRLGTGNPVDEEIAAFEKEQGLDT